MDIFDPYIEQVNKALAHYQSVVGSSKELWPTAERNPYIVVRDMAVELGGYPEESVNLLLSSCHAALEDDRAQYFIGDPDLIRRSGHCSYGKIVLLQCDEIDADHAYDYLKSTEFVEYRTNFRDVMTRTSGEQFFTNLRIGKKALAQGFSLEKMGNVLLDQLLQLPHVQKAKIVFILGASPLYRELLPVAEKVKEITVALNKVFEGIEFDCDHCNLSAICAEVDGLRKMHTASLGMGSRSKG